MPLTAFQAEIVRLIRTNRTPDSYLAGGAAIHLEPNTVRYSHDLDYFHDTPERVASAYEADRRCLVGEGFEVELKLQQRGFSRAIVRRGEEATKIEWAYDSAWRFLPVIEDPVVGFRLHPIDLAINKLLALVGRDKARDFIDIMQMHRSTLVLGALCWAATGKDPGLAPGILMSLLRRRGRYRPEEFEAVELTEPIDLPTLKVEWLDALDAAEAFVAARPTEEMGCLYWSAARGCFVDPDASGISDAVPHFGRPGGVLPSVV